MVVNNSKVLPARLRGTKLATGGAIEILLVDEVSTNHWWVMLKPGKRVRPGTKILLLDRKLAPSGITAEVLQKDEEGRCLLRFCDTPQIRQALASIGEIPLPPYISREAGGPTSQDDERYQTVYARAAGSVAAPTAGLHFTPEILERIQGRGVVLTEVTLHVGMGTFAPVKVDSVSDHRMHTEDYEISDESARAISRAKQNGGRVFAIGTTSLRVLESVFRAHGEVKAATGKTGLFVYPPAEFGVVDALFTNFHLPESTLLMLASAFAAPGRTSGRELILGAYAEAVREKYRFFSYGDAMLIL